MGNTKLTDKQKVTTMADSDYVFGNFGGKVGQMSIPDFRSHLYDDSPDDESPELSALKSRISAVEDKNTEQDARISANTDKIETVESTANAAKSAAENAQTAADTAQETATAASTAAQEAQTAADTAKAEADEAKATADEAKQTADTTESGLNSLTNSAVRCTAQEFSEDEKSIVRNNIDAPKKKTVDTYIEQVQTAIMQGAYKKTDLVEVIPKGSIITSISGDVINFFPYNSNLTLDTSILIKTNVLPYTLPDDCYGVASYKSGNLIIGYSKLIPKELDEYLEEEVIGIKEDISNIKEESSLTNNILFKNKKIAVFGDSITHMTGPEGKSYSDWIAEYTGAEVVNLGIGGATIRQRATPSLDPASAEQEEPPRNVFNVAFSSLDVVNMVKAFVSGDTSYQEAAKQWANDNPSADGASTIIGQIDSIDKLIASDIKDFDAIIIMAGTNDFWNTGTTFIDEPTGNLGYTGEAIKEIIKEIKSYSNKEIAIYWFTPIVRFCDPYPFDIYTSYQEGDRVTYNNKRYEFNIEHPAGTWVGTDVTEITVEESHDIKGWGSNFKNRNKITLEEFSNRLFNLVKSQNIDICDMYHNLGWTFWNFKRFCLPTDRTHPHYGLQYIGRKISSWIISHNTVL